MQKKLRLQLIMVETVEIKPGELEAKCNRRGCYETLRGIEKFN